MIAWASATLFRFDLPSAVQCSTVSPRIFSPRGIGGLSTAQGRGERGREGEREQEGRELNYFVELEGEKVIDKVVPLHLAPSLAPSSLRRFAPARRGRSSVRFGATATLGAKRRKRRKDEARVIHASSPSPPDLVWVADNLESFG